MKRRVVITGLGIVSSLGLTVEEYWDGLLAGRSGISRIEKFDASAHRTQIGGEIKNWDFAPHMDRKYAKRNDLSTQYAIVAAQQAVVDAGLLPASGIPFGERPEGAIKIDPGLVDLDRTTVEQA